jgi:peptidyl-dipeptidase A
MLEMGASRPWPEALEAVTGERQMDGTALRDYFRPLEEWLKKENRSAPVGW